MKKTLLLAFALVVSGALMAQFSIGPKIGYTTSKLSVDKSDITSDLKSSFLYGAFVRLGDKVYIQPEINFYTAGSVFKAPSLNGISPVEDEINLKTIQIPLYIGFKLADLKLANIRAQAGPTANIISDKKINPLKSLQIVKTTDIKDIMWGFQLGAGVDVLMFTLDVQYYIGLNNVIGDIQYTNSAGQQETVKFDSKQNGFMVSLGWKIL